MFRKLVHFVTLVLMISVFAHGFLHADDSFSEKDDNCQYCQLAEQNITVDDSFVFEKEFEFVSILILLPKDSSFVQSILKPFASPRGPPGKLNFAC